MATGIGGKKFGLPSKSLHIASVFLVQFPPLVNIYSQNSGEKADVDVLFREVQAFTPYLLLAHIFLFRDNAKKTPRGLR